MSTTPPAGFAGVPASRETAKIAGNTKQLQLINETSPHVIFPRNTPPVGGKSRRERLSLVPYSRADLRVLSEESMHPTASDQFHSIANSGWEFRFQVCRSAISTERNRVDHIACQSL